MDRAFFRACLYGLSTGRTIGNRRAYAFQVSCG